MDITLTTLFGDVVLDYCQPIVFSFHSYSQSYSLNEPRRRTL